jgi:hypothetical protein
MSKRWYSLTNSRGLPCIYQNACGEIHEYMTRNCRPLAIPDDDLELAIDYFGGEPVFPAPENAVPWDQPETTNV